jgi:glycosyltransferase involved in cell wall biosynthesis
LLADLRRRANTSSVRFLASTDDVRKVYAAADVVILPSATEGMSAVLLEAAACGRAVVATNVGASDEIVVPGETGFLVSPGDVPAMTAALRAALVDADQLGAAAERRIADYRIERIAERWLAFLHDLVHQTRRGVR